MAKKGRPQKFFWNQEQARRITQMAMIGCSDDHISAIEDMSDWTLKKIYAKELSNGRAKGVGAIAQTLYQMALSGKIPAATFFYLKCKARWKEVHQIEHTGENGEPIKAQVTIKQFTKEQIKQAAKAIAEEDSE